MKIAVRETVDGEDVTVVLIQPGAEAGQFIRLAKLPRSRVAQTQADGVRPACGDSLANSQRVLVE